MVTRNNSLTCVELSMTATVSASTGTSRSADARSRLESGHVCVFKHLGSIMRGHSKAATSCHSCPRRPPQGM